MKRYQNLSKKTKRKKRQYRRESYKNLSENEKKTAITKKTKAVEFRKKYIK